MGNRVCKGYRVVNSVRVRVRVRVNIIIGYKVLG
jgi:hypothetical protein